MRAILVAATFAASFLVGISGEAVADCKPLSIISSIDLVPAQDKRAEFVPVTLGGASKLMLLDTGGAFTEITPGTADELKLDRVTSGVTQYGVTGKHSNQFVTTSFKLGNLTSERQALMVSEDPNFFGGDARFGGILGPDILHNYDVHVDFGANKLDVLSQDHCEGKVIYWPADAVAVVPMRVLGSNHIMITVKLDGREVNALIDTGASSSTLYAASAETIFGLKLGSADTPADGTLSNSTAKIYKHTFKTLDFDGVAVGNLNVEIIPDLVGEKIANVAPVGTRFTDRKYDDDKDDMLIGMNVLRHLQIYIAYKEQKLYITPAGNAAAAAPPSPPQAPATSAAAH